jgi:ubiquinone/menaquinone biosynthesis C-methylase UbiE
MGWRQWFAKPPAAHPLPDIIRHFNDAAADEENFPATIDPRIYHVRLILEHFGDLAGRRVLDVGSGKGRFARVLKDRHPGASMVAFDLAEAMLRRVPAGIRACAGSMTRLPFRTESFDCVYATESLEHAVDIEAAVAEICRVAKPGARIVIIDKNREQWGRLKTPPWEKWFGRKEIERLLARHCRRVSSRPISYWEDVAPDGLFLAWLAEK